MQPTAGGQPPAAAPAPAPAPAPVAVPALAAPPAAYAYPPAAATAPAAYATQAATASAQQAQAAAVWAQQAQAAAAAAYMQPAVYAYAMPAAVPAWDAQAALKRQQEEEAEKRRKLEAQRREEARKREEEAKKKREAQMRAKEEEMRKRREAEEQRRNEQRATLAVRRVIQRVRLATIDNLSQLEKELEDILKVELENTGTQKEQIKQESEKGLEQAKKRIELLVEARKKEQEKKEAEEKRKAEQEARVKELVKELSDLVDAAEAACEKLKELSAPLEDGSAEKSVAEVERCAAAIEEAGDEAKAAIKACTDFILAKGPEMKDTAPAFPGVQTPASETKQTLAKLLQRINDSSKSVDTSISAARGAKDTAVRRASARAKTKTLEALFRKHDKDKDKALNKVEVSAYIKGELKTTLAQDALAKLFESIVDEGEKGVVFNKLFLVRSAIGVNRELARDRKRKAEREAKEKLILSLQGKLKDKVKATEKIAETAEKELLKAEEAVAPLASKARTTPHEEMVKVADQCDKLIKAATNAISSVRQKIAAVPDGFDEKHKTDLADFIKSQVKALDIKMGRSDYRLNRATNLTNRFRQQAARKRAAEFDRIRNFAMKVARNHMKVQDWSVEDFYITLSRTSKDKLIDEKDFLKFFSSADKDINEELFDASELNQEGEKAAEEAEAAEGETKPEAEPKVQKTSFEKVDLTPVVLKSLFKHLSDGKPKLSNEGFNHFMQMYFKVLKETPLTEDITVNGTNAVRQLQVNEVVELLEGPKLEESLKVMRIRGKAVSDGAEGWITYVGSQGTAFLKEGGSLFKVLRESVLTPAFEPPEDLSQIEGARRLKEGEVIEVLEWPQKHEESGLTRMRVKAKIDGASGWVTQTNKDGVHFVDVV